MIQVNLDSGAFSCLACGREYHLPDDQDILDTLVLTDKCFSDDGETDCPGLNVCVADR